MRSAKVDDYWRTVYKKNYDTCLLKINLNKLNHINTEIDFQKGITAFCGLNGVGKSTIISALKDIMGAELTLQDRRRVNSSKLEGSFILNQKEVCCNNGIGGRFLNKIEDEIEIRYVDSLISADVQNYITKQDNFDEWLDQYEEFEVPEKDLKDINYLIGKSYDSCVIREVDGIGEDKLVPFFSVKTDGIEYDTRNMGSGEHFLLYLFWVINSIPENSFLILEEPETLISIFSQKHLSDYMGKVIIDKKIQIILTTHSPFILKNIKDDNIRIVSRLNGTVSIINPCNDLSFSEMLGIDLNYKGTLFVEDAVAFDFLRAILEDKAPWILKQYAIDIANGESKISSILKFPKNKNIHYKFIGIYDGDMRGSVENQQCLNWEYTFLPGNFSFEKIVRDKIKDNSNLEKFCHDLNVDRNNISAVLSTIDGDDLHDWFLNFCKKLSVSRYTLVKSFYDSLMSTDSSIDEFVGELQKVLESD